MKKLTIDFFGNGTACKAHIELKGIRNSWSAEATIDGHPTVHELRITYRLGDFLSPMFTDQNTLSFFSPLLEELAEKANLLLPEE